MSTIIIYLSKIKLKSINSDSYAVRRSGYIKIRTSPSVNACRLPSCSPVSHSAAAAGVV